MSARTPPAGASASPSQASADRPPAVWPEQINVGELGVVVRDGGAGQTDRRQDALAQQIPVGTVGRRGQCRTEQLEPEVGVGARCRVELHAARGRPVAVAPSRRTGCRRSGSPSSCDRPALRSAAGSAIPTCAWRAGSASPRPGHRTPATTSRVWCRPAPRLLSIMSASRSPVSPLLIEPISNRSVAAAPSIAVRILLGVTHATARAGRSSPITWRPTCPSEASPVIVAGSREGAGRQATASTRARAAQAATTRTVRRCAVGVRRAAIMPFLSVRWYEIT